MHTYSNYFLLSLYHKHRLGPLQCQTARRYGESSMAGRKVDGLLLRRSTHRIQKRKI